MKSVVVYRSNYLALSETFISDHLRALKTYRPIVAYENEMEAAHKVDLKPHKLWKGPIGRQLFEMFGVSPTLSALIKRERPALIHAHFLTDAVRIVPFVERNCIPLIVTAHGYDATSYDEYLSTFAEGRLLLKRADRLARAASLIVCVSDFIRDTLIKRGYPEEKLVTVPLGIDLEVFAQRPAEVLGRGVITVGRLVEKKGTRHLIEAYAQLPSGLKDMHPLTIIGDGPLRKDLEALADSLGVKVNFLGSRQREEALELVAASRVFAFPSVQAANGDAEGMGIAIMEALALGVPVAIFSNQPMAPFILKNQSGLVANDADSKDLGERLQEILMFDELAIDLRKRGRNMCEENFSLKRCNFALEKIYDRFGKFSD